MSNVCEHGDHPAPDGKRFCGAGCLVCENESDDGCDGFCHLYEEGIAQGRALERQRIVAIVQRCVGRDIRQDVLDEIERGEHVKEEA